MTDHTVEAHFEVKADAAAANQAMAAANMVRNIVTDCMAQSIIGAPIQPNVAQHVIAKAQAVQTYTMVITMLQKLSELGVLNFKVTVDK